MEEKRKIEKKGHRKHIRFGADTSVVAKVTFSEELSKFKHEFTALAQNESYSGCCLVVLSNPGFESGKQCLVQVGVLNPVKAIIRWTEEIDEDVLRVGLEYLLN